MNLHDFRDPQLEMTALTHKSYGRPHNERLEWLGDSVLSLAVSKILWERFPDTDEGTLTEIRISLVRNDTLAAAARRAGFPKRLRLGGCERATEGHDKNSILSAALEAYMGAIFLDGGDPAKVARDLLAGEIEERAKALEAGGLDTLKDAKTRLQEMLQKAGHPPPVYENRHYLRAGRPFFRAQCTVEGQTYEGRGKSVSRAEKGAAEAAVLALEKMGGVKKVEKPGKAKKNGKAK